MRSLLVVLLVLAATHAEARREKLSPTEHLAAFSGDYDGDGQADTGLFWFSETTQSTWITVSHSSGWGGNGPITFVTTVPLGQRGDVPVPGDYDGDGRADLAVYRPTTGVWYIRPSGGAASVAIPFGAAHLGDVPVPADYDGDGVTDLAVRRMGTAETFVWLSGHQRLLRCVFPFPCSPRR